MVLEGSKAMKEILRAIYLFGILGFGFLFFVTFMGSIFLLLSTLPSPHYSALGTYGDIGQDFYWLPFLNDLPLLIGHPYGGCFVRVCALPMTRVGCATSPAA